MYPKVELERRVNLFQEVLQKNNIDGVLLVQRADTLYFSGTAQNIHVYIPREGKPIILSYRDVDRTKEETPWDVIPLKGISKIPQIIESYGYKLPKTLGLEYDVLPVANFERYRKNFPNTELVDISYDLRLLRAVKSQWEISQIEDTAKIYSALVDYVPTIIRQGMTEIELESLLEAKARSLGHETMVRCRGFNSEYHLGGIVSGARAGIPSYFDGPIGGLGASAAHPLGPSHNPIGVNEPIVMDLALAKNGYIHDATRILVIGELSSKLEEAYKITLELEERIRESLVPGRITGEIYTEVIEWVNKTPYAEYFMGYGQSQVKFVAHGVGVELDELPTISKGAKEVLVPGMVLSVEPKFVFPGEGAVGIEDTFVVEGDSGARCLTNSPRDIIRI